MTRLDSIREGLKMRRELEKIDKEDKEARKEAEQERSHRATISQSPERRWKAAALTTEDIEYLEQHSRNQTKNLTQKKKEQNSPRNTRKGNSSVCSVYSVVFFCLHFPCHPRITPASSGTASS
jgi:hypothetical protein